MHLSARKHLLRSDKKPPTKSPASNDKTEACTDAAPISTDDLLLRVTKLMDEKLSDCRKILDK